MAHQSRLEVSAISKFKSTPLEIIKAAKGGSKKDIHDQ
jgi:hypothetical protein